MASSRIIQLRPEQLSCAVHQGEDESMMTLDDLKENNSFVGSIAKYVSGGSDRIKDFNWLIKILQNQLSDEHEKYLSWRCNEDDSEMPDAWITEAKALKMMSRSPQCMLPKGAKRSRTRTKLISRAMCLMMKPSFGVSTITKTVNTFT